LLVKVTKGSNHKELFDYLFDPMKQAQIDKALPSPSKTATTPLFLSTVPGRTIEELARNFRWVAKLNPKVKKTIAHYSISLSTEDNGKVGIAEMRLISEGLLRQLGYARSPYFGVEHHDTNHRHWHLAVSTVGYDGKWVDDSFDRYHIRQVEKDLELKFGLKQTQPRPAADIKNLSTGEYRLKQRTKQLVPKEKLWAAIDECIPISSTLLHLLLELRVKHSNISIQLKEKAGKHVGISFAVDGVAFSGKKLGRAYSLSGLERYHGVYHSAESKALLDKVLALPVEECRELYQGIREQQPVYQSNAVYGDASEPQIEL